MRGLFAVKCRFFGGGWLGKEGTIKVFPHLKCGPIDLITHARKYINPRFQPFQLLDPFEFSPLLPLRRYVH